MSERRYDFLLSYNQTDIEAVRLLASELSDVGVHVWFDQWELVPGQDWSASLRQAMELSNTIGICIGSKGSSKWHEDELRLALGIRQQKPSCLIVTILMPGTRATDIP